MIDVTEEQEVTQHPDGVCGCPWCPCYGEDGRAAQVLDDLIDGLCTAQEAYRLVSGLQVNS